jgi:hypothetical protein
VQDFAALLLDKEVANRTFSASRWDRPALHASLAQLLRRMKRAILVLSCALV